MFKKQKLVSLPMKLTLLADVWSVLHKSADQWSSAGIEPRIHGIWIRRLTTRAISLLVRDLVEKGIFIVKDNFAIIFHTKTTQDVPNHTILIVSHLQAPPTMTSQASQARSQSNTTGLDHPIQPYRVGLNVPWEL